MGAVGVVLAALALWYTRRTRQRRALACEFQSIEFPIEIKAGEAYKGDIEVLYKGEAIENLYLVRARLKNTGNVPIRGSEVVRPLTFAFNPDTTLMRLIVADRKPENLKTNWDSYTDAPDLSGVDADGWILAFDLLNPDDEITAEFLCTGKVTLPKATARIEGISEIGVLDPEEMRLRQELARNTAPSLFGSVLILVIFGVSVYRVWKGNVPVEDLPSLAITAAFFIMVLWSVSLVRSVRLARYRRRNKDSYV